MVVPLDDSAPMYMSRFKDIPSYIIVIICRQSQVFEEVIRQCVAKITTIQLQAKELAGCQSWSKIEPISSYHHAEPTEKHEIRLPNGLAFLGNRP